MKFLVILIAAILVPIFAWIHHQSYQSRLKPRLLEEVRESLKNPELASLSPEVSGEVALDHLDVVLKGEAPTAELREQARAAADAISGARATEANNHITVPGSLFLERSAEGLKAHGWVPEAFRDTLAKKLKDRGVSLSDDDLKTADFIQGPDWLWKPEFDLWLNQFLAGNGKRSLAIHGKSIELKGDATEELRISWLQGLRAQLPHGVKISEYFQLFPSVYHFPGYKYSAKIETPAYQKLAASLSSSDIHFDVGSAIINESELPKITSIVAAIQEAGGNVSYVVGGHTDATGDLATNQRLSRERAQAVALKLIELGVSAHALETVAFGASQTVGSNETETSRQLSRRVEVLVK